MADTNEFFNTYLPAKVGANPGLAASIDKVFVFDITGAGQWTFDCTNGGTISEGAEGGDCVITIAKEDWESLLDNPGLAMQLFFTGKLVASNPPLAMQLQKILG